MQQLPPANKATSIANGIKYGLPILAVGIGIYAVKKLLPKKNPDGTSSRVAPSIKGTVIDRQNLTISASDAAVYANTLYGAMLGFGTDEEAICSTVAKIQSKDDMLLVIKAFGMKQYLWGTRAAFLGQDFNLIGWFRQELSESEISKIKPKFDSWGIPL